MSDDSPGPAHADEIRRLLIGYSTALDCAESLPPLIRVASRPRRWTLCEPLRRLPRSTIGTHSMVVHHARRSAAELQRRYARIAATRGLTDDERHAGQLVDSFSQSLPHLRWKLIVAGGLIGVFVAVQLIVGVVSGVLTRAAEAPSRDPVSDRVRTLAESLIRAGSNAPTANSFIDLFGQFGNAGLIELFALTATIVVAAYVVLRPLHPAFRMKRLIFNLSGAGPVDVQRTTTTWNVTRSVGLYELERDVFSRLGTRPPREIDLDLWISTVPPAAVIALLVTGDFGLLIEDLSVLYFMVIVVAVPVTARLIWLAQTGIARHRDVLPTDPPAGFTTTDGGPVVESRSLVETAGLGLLTSYLLSATLLVPSPIWIRQVQERRDLGQARSPSGSPANRPASLPWRAAGSAMLLWLLPVVPVSIHLTQLIRLAPNGFRSAHTTRAWLVPLSLVSTILVVFDIWFRQPRSGDAWIPVYPLVAAATATIIIGAVQREHNALFARIGVPLPFDQPMAPAELDRLPVPTLALAHAAYTPWHIRVFALLIDIVPPAILAAAGTGYAWATGEQVCEAVDSASCPFTVSGTGSTVLLVTAALILAFAIWNWGVRQGATGSSIGKSVVGVEVVGEKTGQPIGFERSMVRQLAHLADCATLFVGWLLPLWDDKRRTLADKLLATVCLPTPRTTAHPQREATVPRPGRARLEM